MLKKTLPARCRCGATWCAISIRAFGNVLSSRHATLVIVREAIGGAYQCSRSIQVVNITAGRSGREPPS